MKRLLLLALFATLSLAQAHAEPALEDGLAQPYPMPAITGIAQWYNSPPLTAESLKGKVVLVDFWTYTCINCIRTLPYLKAWDAKYRDKGLVIIGVHSPEFDFEKDPKNVAQAVKRFGIQYPVALDADLATWNAFHNQYWPAHYLIDRQGRVIYTHFGEGKYDVTERNIQTLLGMDGGTTEDAGSAVSTRDQSPETYLGSMRAENFASAESQAPYTFPAQLGQNGWALSGSWQIAADRITAQAAGAALRYQFRAGKVFLVMGPAPTGAVTVEVWLNGKPITTDKAGKDVKGGKLTVDSQRLYELVDLHGSPADGLLELRPEAKGLSAYAFTFGK